MGKGKTNVFNCLLIYFHDCRNHVNKYILRIIYFTIFDYHINYSNLIWSQNLNTVSRIIILQKKALSIMNFHSRDSHWSPLFKSNHIMKLEDKILIEYILLINESFNNLLPPVFKSWFTFSLMFTIIKQSHLLLIRYLNHLIELILTEKIQSL